MDESAATDVRTISKCTIKPQLALEPFQKTLYLTPWDYSLLSLDYMQTGLLFNKPKHISIQTIVDELKQSLSTALIHFFPLLGGLVTNSTLDPPSSSIFFDCEGGQGAEFVHAAIDVTISNIISPKDVPSSLVEFLFALDKPVSHDGHFLPLLAVQVTELIDGIFIGCSFCHVVGDGASFWHFFNAWSEISRSKGMNSHSISRPPITKRWFLNEENQMIKLPYSHPDEFLNRYIAAEPFIERIFHFTAQSIAHLKEKANEEMNCNNISSFQSLGALVWKAVTRARRLLPDQKTECIIVVDDRSRLDPPIPRDYFGNCVLPIAANTTTKELLSKNLGWSASMLHQEIAKHTNIKVRSVLESYAEAPFIIRYADLLSTGQVGYGMSPRYDVYTNDFGWGKPVAVRSGHGGKFDGKVTWYPGSEGGGSMDLEICLSSESMDLLEEDHDFMDAVSPAPMV